MDDTKDHIFLIKSGKRKLLEMGSGSIISQIYPWHFPINKKIPSEYSYRNGQSLMEFSYRVAVHNREASMSDPSPIKLDPPGFDVVIPLNSTVLYNDVNVLWFFYSTSMNIAVIVFTSTYNNILWSVDINFLQKDPTTICNYTSGMMLHGGFWSLYQDIQDRLISLIDTHTNKSTQIIITGYSLGGAMSTIGMLDLYNRTILKDHKIRNIIHYSFASPKCLNTIGSNHYLSLKLNSYRVTNGSDIVPTSPLAIMPLSQDFTHVDTMVYFNDNMCTLYDNHVTSYIKYYNILEL